MTAILGISAFYHDSAAALVVDGEIVAAAQEERFTRRKHDDRFPTQAVDVLPGRGRARAGRRARLRRVLRQAAAEVRAAARNLSGVRAAGIPIVPRGAAAVAQAQAAPAARAAAGARRRVPPALRVPRAPRVARGQRVLSVAVRRGRDPDARRRRRVGDRERGRRARQPDRADEEMHFPHSLGLLYSGVHVLLRVSRSTAANTS